MVDPEKFINFVSRDKNEICIVGNKDLIEKIKGIAIGKNNVKPYLIINDQLKDSLVLFYK
ncbi:hypothetical protein SJAV_10050 [Sulfurisphaera javensis]|uniref:DUF5678 domain-containing protein n=1 Tax=Sulfurisphaera javensis TaxID=2049879 RepID=A0AAT9GQI1_9CREN